MKITWNMDPKWKSHPILHHSFQRRPNKHVVYIPSSKQFKESTRRNDAGEQSHLTSSISVNAERASPGRARQTVLSNHETALGLEHN